MTLVLGWLRTVEKGLNMVNGYPTANPSSDICIRFNFHFRERIWTFSWPYRLLALNTCLCSAYTAQKLIFIDNFNLLWEQRNSTEWPWFNSTEWRFIGLRQANLTCGLQRRIMLLAFWKRSAKPLWGKKIFLFYPVQQGQHPGSCPAFPSLCTQPRYLTQPKEADERDWWVLTLWH